MSRKIAKCLGCRGAKQIINNLEDASLRWEVVQTPTLSPFGVSVTYGNTSVVVFPNERCPCQRIFDTVRVLVNGVDFYVPLSKRLKIRKAARARVQYQAFSAL